MFVEYDEVADKRRSRLAWETKRSCFGELEGTGRGCGTYNNCTTNWLQITLRARLPCVYCAIAHNQYPLTLVR
jgi:hypothetical protein